MKAYDEGCRTHYEIPAENYEKFEQQVAKLSKRAVRLGLDPIIPMIFDRFKRPVSEKKPEGEQYLVYRVLFTAETVKIDGWRFVARIDHSNETGNIVRPMPNSGVEMPTKYRTTDPDCDHCKVRRYRRDTYIVCNEVTNEFHQVGSTCLADFLGHDPYRLARTAEFLGYADEAARGASEYIGGGDYRWIDVEEFLVNAAWAVRRFGWTPKSAVPDDFSKSTAARTWRNYRPYGSAEIAARETPSEEDRQNAAEALAWAQGLRTKGESEGTPLSEYEHNISVIAGAVLIEDRSTGLAASIVGVYLRNKGRAEMRAARDRSQRDSVHFGTVGERLRDLDCTVLTKFQIDGYYGVSYIYTFLTNDGNVVKWKGTKNLEIVAGNRVRITGTLKAHGHYREIAQTELTRCAVTLLDEQKAAA